MAATTAMPTSKSASPVHRSGMLSTELESLLNALLSEQQALLSELKFHREALRKANGAAVQSSVDRQAGALRRIAALEDKRASLVKLAVASPGFKPAAGKPAVTLSQLASMVEEPARTRLIALAEQLRSVISDCQREQGTLKAATSSLVAHLEGLMNQVARRLSHAGTYGRRGVVEATSGVVMAIDLTH